MIARRHAVLLIAFALGMLLGPAALAGSGGEVTLAGGSAQVREPAVVVEPSAPADDTPAWTFRYLIPTGMVIGVAAVLVTIIQYFVRVVRSRYRLVE